MTKQAIFNKVYRHATTQKSKAMDSSGGYVYLAPNGAKCFIGCLISKRNYKPEMEGRGIFVLKAQGLLPKHLEEHALFLSELQNIHDYSPLSVWKHKLARKAKDFGLKVPQS